ncbi:MAG: hypothetical protein IJU92_04710 [Spirochaetaceae bacterium]|nr:hypothetical protein [Spirochaetaceae bacterium]
MENYNHQKEIREAINAGKRAKASLNEARNKLNSAKNWGILDILGGGLISGLLKHSRIKDASKCIENAKHDMRDFEQELGDIRDIESLRIEIGDFLTFADFFFDGLIADIFVQSKIKDAKNQIDTAISHVDRILARLEAET